MYYKPENNEATKDESIMLKDSRTTEQASTDQNWDNLNIDKDNQ